MDLFSSEQAKRAPSLLNRGRISASTGDVEAARDDFRRALIGAASARNPATCLAMPGDLYLPQVALLFEEMQEVLPTSPEANIWQEAVQEVSCTP
jgi:hypothetical protein